MKTQEEKKIEEQKAKEITKKERKTSVSYTLQRFKTVLLSLSNAKMITAEEKIELSRIYNTINNREIGEELNL